MGNHKLAEVLSVANEVSGALWFGNLHVLMASLNDGFVGCTEPGCICPAMHTEWSQGNIWLKEGPVDVAMATVWEVESGPILKLRFRAGAAWLECLVCYDWNTTTVRLDIETDCEGEAVDGFARLVEWLSIGSPFDGAMVTVTRRLMASVLRFAFDIAARTGQQWYGAGYLPNLSARLE